MRGELGKVWKIFTTAVTEDYQAKERNAIE
jgi:hypothetical protein